jgi:benzoyl-CoA reductase/2-hydroxyglutaryl-CoA dehydratase subunit BcrC/BadD/HgdB
MRVGYACAYTPLPLIHAAGFTPYRVLPLGDAEDQAGRLMHDNLCPHVKRILDRALSDDLPGLAGMVLLNSCDAMRRLADAWQKARPDDRVVLLDLPVAQTDRSTDYFVAELSRLSDALGSWGGTAVTDAGLVSSVGIYNEIASLLDEARVRLRRGTLSASRMQEIMILVSTDAPDRAIAALKTLLEEPEPSPASGVPVFVFGNVLPDPRAMELIESCGARVVDEDMCTGSRLVCRVDVGGADPILHALAAAVLSRPPCARTLISSRPGSIAAHIVERAKAARARGVIGHTLKFCDPYLARVPVIREALQRQDIPFLFLEGDCTLRSLGQHRTRIEAFVEMLT